MVDYAYIKVVVSGVVPIRGFQSEVVAANLLQNSDGLRLLCHFLYPFFAVASGGAFYKQCIELWAYGNSLYFIAQCEKWGNGAA